MQSTTIVRPAERRDIGGIQRVADETWHATYAGKIPDDAIRAFVRSNYNPGQLERAIERLGPGALVADSGGEIVGYAMVSGDRDGNAQLWSIYVLPAFQRRGIGKQLWDAAVDRAVAEGFPTLTFWVLDSNDQARTFYERQGAQQSGERDFPMGEESVREVMYVLSLNPRDPPAHRPARGSSGQPDQPGPDSMQG